MFLSVGGFLLSLWLGWGLFAVAWTWHGANGSAATTATIHSVCNSPFGQLGQVFSANASLWCGRVNDVYRLAQVFFWAGLALVGVAGVLWLLQERKPTLPGRDYGIWS